ncbi:MAG: hypothetical protein MZW92_44585 [Comamonadaceae bacterium]|nr:hypothetical protein [Comamonadaceae bacterium]
MRVAAEATAWFRKAAEQGWRDAQVSAGHAVLPRPRRAARLRARRRAGTSRRPSRATKAPATSWPACTRTAMAWRATSLRAYYWYAQAAARRRSGRRASRRARCADAGSVALSRGPTARRSRRRCVPLADDHVQRRLPWPSRSTRHARPLAPGGSCAIWLSIARRVAHGGCR